jgi:hypothetical protein
MSLTVLKVSLVRREATIKIGVCFAHEELGPVCNDFDNHCVIGIFWYVFLGNWKTEIKHAGGHKDGRTAILGSKDKVHIS